MSQSALCTLSHMASSALSPMPHDAKLTGSGIQGPCCTRKLLKCVPNDIGKPRRITETLGEKLRECLGAAGPRAPMDAAPNPGGADGPPLDEGTVAIDLRREVRSVSGTFCPFELCVRAFGNVHTAYHCLSCSCVCLCLHETCRPPLWQQRPWLLQSFFCVFRLSISS